MLLNINLYDNCLLIDTSTMICPIMEGHNKPAKNRIIAPIKQFCKDMNIASPYALKSLFIS